MKKIMFLFSAVLTAGIILALTSGRPSASSAAFLQDAIEVSQLGPCSAEFHLNPTGDNQYFWDVMPAELFDAIQAGQNPNCMNMADYTTQNIQGWTGVDIPMSDILSQGAAAASINLKANTEYVAYAVLVDPATGVASGNIITKRFATR